MSTEHETARPVGVEEPDQSGDRTSVGGTPDMSVPINDDSPTADQRSVTDTDVLEAIERLAVDRGKTPGRDAVMGETGIGATRAKRLLTVYRDQSGQPLRAVPDRSDEMPTMTMPTAKAPVADQSDNTVPDRSESTAVHGSTGYAGSPTNPVDRTESAAALQEQDNPDRSAPAPDRSEIDEKRPYSTGQTGESSAEPTGHAASADRSADRPVTGPSLSEIGLGWLDRKLNGPSFDRSETASASGRMPTFLWVISALVALPALLTIWSGWVSLGLATGWKEVQMFPSVPFLESVELNAVVFLPFSVEVLTITAFGFFFHYRGTAIRWWSGATGLITVGLGLFGQGWSHHLQAANATPPGWLVVFTSGLPVVAMALVGVLVHLARDEHAKGGQK